MAIQRVGFDHIALKAKELAKSSEFYRIFGAEKISQPSDKFLELDLHGLRLHIIQDNDPQTRGGIDHFCLRVDSRESLCELQMAVGMTSHYSEPPQIVTSEPMGDSPNQSVELQPPREVMYVSDPDGNIIEIRSYD